MQKRLLKTTGIIIFATTVVLVGSGFKNGYFEIAKQIEIFTTLFKELNMNYVDETNPAELMDTAIKNMLEELDPYTQFLNEQDVEAYRINNAGKYSGIGAMIKSYEDKILIVEPYKGYPADMAGLKAGDEIIKIGAINIADVSEDVAELLKGAANTEVQLTYRRQGKVTTTTLKREGITVDAVPYYQMVNDQSGYIVLARFNQKAYIQTKKALEDLLDQGAKSIILDLRDNPGGLLSEAIDVTNLFVPKGELIVTTKSKVKKFNKEYRTNRQPVAAEIPLTVLVNGRSASASEIVSGSLQDLDRAVVMGARSFGKGLVQRPLKLTYGTQLKVTISRYYTPSGRCIQALDYWHRDENGKAVKSEQHSNFKTKNGRPVQDGGGVLPDVEIASLKTNSLIQEIENKHAIFDFATQYYYNHTLENVSDFSFSNKDYEQFKSFVNQGEYNFETETEKALKKLMGEEKDLMKNNSIASDYKQLMGSIAEAKSSVLDTYNKELKKQLSDEIITRYFYREGLYDYYLTEDEAILAATALMQDSQKYQSTLQ